MNKLKVKPKVKSEPSKQPACAINGGNNDLHSWKYDYTLEKNVCKYCGITNAKWGEIYRIDWKERMR